MYQRKGIIMNYAQYCRIESKAGGASCTVREFVRACHSVLSDAGKGRDKRDLRHEWIRAGLCQRQKARDLIARYRF